MLAGQHGLEPFLHQLLAGPGDGVDAGIQGRGDLAVAPCFAGLRGISLQQDACLASACRAGCLPVWISVLSRSRSSSLSFTTYFFTAICFAVTKHLRHCGVSESEFCRRINDRAY